MLIPARSFALNSPVQVVDGWGQLLWEGSVAEWVGPFSVNVRLKSGMLVFAATSLLRVKGDPMEELIIQQLAEIGRLQQLRARASEALERYLAARYGERRPNFDPAHPWPIDEADLREVIHATFDK